jgi:hypothetical protein
VDPSKKSSISEESKYNDPDVQRKIRVPSKYALIQEESSTSLSFGHGDLMIFGGGKREGISRRL